MIRRPPRSTLSSSSAASDVYKRQATRKGPTAQLPAHDCSTTSRIKQQRRQRAAGTPFSTRNGPPSPTGRSGTIRNLGELRLFWTVRDVDALLAGAQRAQDDLADVLRAVREDARPRLLTGLVAPAAELGCRDRRQHERHGDAVRLELPAGDRSEHVDRGRAWWRTARSTSARSSCARCGPARSASTSRTAQNSRSSPRCRIVPDLSLIHIS